MLVGPADAPVSPHVRVRFSFATAGPSCASWTSGRSGTGWSRRRGGLPPVIAHIARDPLEQAFDLARPAARKRARKTGIKRALLDQGLIRGVGNIYADEALWRVRLHWARAGDRLGPGQIAEVMARRGRCPARR